MDVLLTPQMTVAHVGAQYKILCVTGQKGMEMPTHISTKEAVVVVLKGQAVIKISNKEIYLNAGESAIIPAHEPHTLHIKSEFLSHVIMDQDSEIVFSNN